MEKYFCIYFLQWRDGGRLVCVAAGKECVHPFGLRKCTTVRKRTSELFGNGHHPPSEGALRVWYAFCHIVGQ